MPQRLKKQPKKVKLPPPKALKQSPSQTKLLKKLKKITTGGANTITSNDIQNFLFLDPRVSTQQNMDPTFTEYGIVHLCDSIAINALRASVTNFLNAFGSSGFDSSLYDLARNNCLMRIINIIDIKDKELKNEGTDMELKVCNIRFEMLSIDPTLITINAYGTLLGRFKDKQPYKKHEDNEDHNEKENKSVSSK